MALSAASILENLRIENLEYSDNTVRTYAHEPTGREFWITTEEDGDISLEELVPNRRVITGYIQEVPRQIPDVREIEGAREILREASPNELVAKIESLGVSRQDMIRTGPACPGDSKVVVYPSLQAAAEEICASIEENRQPVSFKRKSSLEIDSGRLFEAKSSVGYFQSYLEQMIEAKQRFSRSDDPVDIGMTMFGRPWGDEIREQVRAYLDAPSQDGWNEIRSLNFLPMVSTLWVAWTEVDPGAPRIDSNNGYPSAKTLREAMTTALSDSMESVAVRLKEARENLHEVEADLEANDLVSRRVESDYPDVEIWDEDLVQESIDKGMSPG